MKFLLIDDHVLIREALQNVLKELACDAVILEASNFRQAQILIEQNADLEVILLDLNLPDGNGLICLRRCASIPLRFRSSSYRPTPTATTC